MGTSKNKKIALDLKDGNGKRVVWYKKSYDWHVNFRHTDIKGCQDKIPKALKTPQLKYIDRKRKATHYFYLQRINAKGQNIYFELIVDYNSTPAFVRTAHLTSHTNDATIC